MHKNTDEVVTVVRQAEECANTNIVDASLHSSVHSLGVVCPVALWTSWVELLVCLAVVRLLEEDICADAGILQTCVVLDSRSCDIYIHTADSSVLMLYRIYGINRLKYILDRAELGVLASLKCQALVSHILQCDNLATNLLLRKLTARNCAILRVVWAIDAAVDAVVRQV